MFQDFRVGGQVQGEGGVARIRRRGLIVLAGAGGADLLGEAEAAEAVGGFAAFFAQDGRVLPAGGADGGFGVFICRFVVSCIFQKKARKSNARKKQADWQICNCNIDVCDPWLGQRPCHRQALVRN